VGHYLEVRATTLYETNQRADGATNLPQFTEPHVKHTQTFFPSLHTATEMLFG